MLGEQLLIEKEDVSGKKREAKQKGIRRKQRT